MSTYEYTARYIVAELRQAGGTDWKAYTVRGPHWYCIYSPCWSVNLYSVPVLYTSSHRYIPAIVYSGPTDMLNASNIDELDPEPGNAHLSVPRKRGREQ